MPATGSPSVDGTVVIISGNRNWTTHYRGVTPDFLAIKRWELVEGAPFTSGDVVHSANVCMIGQTVRQELYGAEKAVGRDIRINKKIFRVMGVLAPKGQSSNGQDQDDTIILPYTTVQKKLFDKTLLFDGGSIGGLFLLVKGYDASVLHQKAGAVAAIGGGRWNGGRSFEKSAHLLVESPGKMAF